MRVETIGDATLYLGDCLEILPTLGKVDAVVTDPPYGMRWNVDGSRFSGGEDKFGRKRTNQAGKCWDAPIYGDDVEFEPSPWLAFDQVILFGSNHYSMRLPVGTTLVWIKRYDPAFGTFLSDAEIAWEKGGHGVYCFRDVSGNGAGANYPKLHPTQKTIGVMSWCVQRTTGSILDPFMGSGTTGVACANLGRKFIGIEIEPKYFDIACERIAAAYAQGRLFA